MTGEKQVLLLNKQTQTYLLVSHWGAKPATSCLPGLNISTKQKYSSYWFLFQWKILVCFASQANCSVPLLPSVLPRPYGCTAAGCLQNICLRYSRSLLDLIVCKQLSHKHTRSATTLAPTLSGNGIQCFFSTSPPTIYIFTGAYKAYGYYNQHETHQDCPIVSVHERCSDVTAKKCTQAVITWDNDWNSLHWPVCFQVFQKPAGLSPWWQRTGVCARAGHERGQTFHPWATRVIVLSCVHAATNCVLLSGTILLCAAEIKHAWA